MDTRQCVFCMEEIRPGASVCPHCGSNLAPLQSLADRAAALEERLAALEQELAALSTARSEQPGAEVEETTRPEPSGVDIKWPHMADNLLLGLATLLAAHWLATTLPGSNRTLFRLVALIVALPFGFRFEYNARSGVTGQVVAALAFGCLGAVAIGILDIALTGHPPPSLTAQDIVASVAAIGLSHYTGSALAHARQQRAARAAIDLNAAAASAAGKPRTHMHLEPARIKTTAEAVKALTDAVAPLATGAAALWAAFGHFLS
jgi:hypothetical protein